MGVNGALCSNKWNNKYSTTNNISVALLPELKSGYPDYPKSGFTRTILVTENRCPKSGYPNSSLFLEYFFWFLFLNVKIQVRTLCYLQLKESATMSTQHRTYPPFSNEKKTSIPLNLKFRAEMLNISCWIYPCPCTTTTTTFLEYYIHYL